MSANSLLGCFDAREQFAKINGVQNEWLVSTFVPYLPSIDRLASVNSYIEQYNEFSTTEFARLSSSFIRSTEILKEMKTDLENVFKRIR
jgi:hypothetical protein